MSNSFVLSRLLPIPSMYWTSWYGTRAASALFTRPFLAFRVTTDDTPGLESTEPHAMLFVVSPQKPTGIYDGCYYALTPGYEATEKTLTVVPPLPSIGRPFYLHAFELAVTLSSYDAVMHRDEHSHLHCLDEHSLRKFCKSVSPIRDLLRARQRSELRKGRSGGHESVEGDWDTFSGQPSQEGLNDPYSCDYEHVPCDSTALPVPKEPPVIYREVMQYHQMVADYSWSGVTAAISGVQKMRELQIAQSQSLLTISRCNTADISGREVPELTGELATTAHNLRAMRIPYDGDPPPVQDVDTAEEEWWDDGPEPYFAIAPKSVPPITHHDLKVIAFDPDGVIVDRESVIRAALFSLVPPILHGEGADELLALFLEYKTLQFRELGPAASDMDLCRAALTGMAESLGTSFDTKAVEKLLDRMTNLDLYADVQPAMRALHAAGLMLVCLSAHADAASSHRIFRALPPGMQHLSLPELNAISDSTTRDSASSSAFTTLLKYCNRTLSGVMPQQVLLVTSGRCRAVEPAVAAGMPTALVCRPGNVESHVPLNGQLPTMTVDGLADLCAQLGFATGSV